MSKMTKAQKEREAENLRQFINALGKDERPSTAARMAGLRALQAQLKTLTATTGPKKRQKYYTNSPQFAVVLAHVQGELSRDDTLEKICTLCACEERTAEKYLADLKPRAEETAEALKALDSFRTN